MRTENEEAVFQAGVAARAARKWITANPYRRVVDFINWKLWNDGWNFEDDRRHVDTWI